MTPLPSSPDSEDGVVFDVGDDMFFDVVEGVFDDAITANAAGDKPVIIGSFAVIRSFVMSALASLCANC